MLTATLSATHERTATLRANMLDAADGFATAEASEAQAAIRIAAGEVLKDRERSLLDAETGWFRHDVGDLLNVANSAVDAVLAKRARVHLLFGSSSHAGGSATAIGNRLRNIEATLERRPDSIRDREAFGEYSGEWDRVVEHHADFTGSVLAALRDSRTRRVRLWLARVIPRLNRT